VYTATHISSTPPALGGVLVLGALSKALGALSKALGALSNALGALSKALGALSKTLVVSGVSNTLVVSVGERSSACFEGSEGQFILWATKSSFNF